MRKLAGKMADIGSWELLDDYVEVLYLLGDAPEDHQPLRPGWSKRIENADRKKASQKSKLLAKSLRKHIGELERSLAKVSPEQKTILARAILRLDSESKLANLALGNVKTKGGWLSETQSQWQAGAERVAGLMSEAWQLEIPLSQVASNNPAARKLYGLNAITVHAHGIHLHGGMASAKMERILHETLRAMAFSNAVRGGKLEVPEVSPPRHLLLTHELDRFEEVVAEAVEVGALNQSQGDEVLRMDLQSYTDGRGWRTSNWQSEADYQALVLWDTYERWMANDVQPCFLAGHLHWLCLNFYGTSMAEVMWRQRSMVRNATAGVDKPKKDDLWKSVGTSFFGCRSWMKQRVKDGNVYPYSDAIVPELGQARLHA